MKKILLIVIIIIASHNIYAQHAKDKCVSGNCRKGTGSEIFYDSYFGKTLMYVGEFYKGYRFGEGKLFEMSESGKFDKHFLTAVYIDDEYRKTIEPNEGECLSYSCKEGIYEQIYYDHHWLKTLRYYGHFKDGKRNGLGMLYQQGEDGRYNKPFIMAEFKDGNIYTTNYVYNRYVSTIINAIFYEGALNIKDDSFKPSNFKNFHPDSQLEVMYHLKNEVVDFSAYDDALDVLAYSKNLKKIHYNHFYEYIEDYPFDYSLDLPLDANMGYCKSDSCDDGGCEIYHEKLRYLGQCKDGIPNGIGMFINRIKEAYWVESKNGIISKMHCVSLPSGISRRHLAMQENPALELGFECVEGNCFNGEGLLYYGYDDIVGALHCTNFENRRPGVGTLYANNGMEISGDFSDGFNGEYDIYIPELDLSLKGYFEDFKLKSTMPDFGRLHKDIVFNYKDSLYSVMVQNAGYTVTKRKYFNSFFLRGSEFHTKTKEYNIVQQNPEQEFAFIFYPQFTGVQYKISLYISGKTIMQLTENGYVEKNQIDIFLNGENTFAEFKIPEQYLNETVELVIDAKVHSIEPTVYEDDSLLYGLMIFK